MGKVVFSFSYLTLKSLMEKKEVEEVAKKYWIKTPLLDTLNSYSYLTFTRN